MARGRRSGVASELPALTLSVVLLGAYVWLLTHATVPLVTVFSFASDNNPKVYAALLAALSALPGLLLTLPRALARRPAFVAPSVRRRSQVAKRPSHLLTDVLGLAALLLAQVPLPSPWSPAGKAATIANITKSAEVVDLSARFATYSLGIFALGIVAAVIAKVYAHAAGLRTIAVMLAVGAPVLAWLVVTRTPG